jgi:hypothetical protein
MILYAATIFLSAFLLFQVQPIIAKMILPWFGGSAAVWNTCMLFFQAMLLAGYLYAHWSIRYLTPRRQAALHATLLGLSLLLLPITPGSGWKPTDAAHPAGRILLLLAVNVGLPYFLLSTTSPLVQAWYTRAGRGAVPYRLFALSNLASLLALPRDCRARRGQWHSDCSPPCARSRLSGALGTPRGTEWRNPLRTTRPRRDPA